MWYIDITEYYSQIKEIFTFATKWTQLETFMFNEISQSQKDKS